MSSSFRPYLTAGITLAGAGLIAVAPPPATDTGVRPVQLTSAGSDLTDGSVGLVVGGSAIPIPQLDADYVTAADTYVQRVLPGAVSHGVFTPEGLSPMWSGVKSLPLDESVAQGRYILDTEAANAVNAGHTVALFGQSQSSTIEGFVMSDLAQQGIPADSVKFVLEGDPSNPDGGLLERFDGLTMPSMGITFSGATPPDTIYDASIYTLEYDGFADFPKYTLNFLADLNAFLGFVPVHGYYLYLTDADLDKATVLPTTPGYDGNTTYYMLPLSATGDDTLPLLRPLESIPVIGKPLADLLNPDLTQLVNLGYDNPANQGWDVGQANVPTEFGLFPSLSQVVTAINNLGPGTEHGVQAALSDIGAEVSNPSSLFADLTSGVGTSPGELLRSPTDVINGLTAAISQAYSALLPTADLASVLTLTMPTYDGNLLMDHLNSPMEAIGLPLAADTALVTLVGGVEAMVIEQTLQDVKADLTGTTVPLPF